MSAKAASISTCHSHQLACQLRANATATIASASRMNGGDDRDDDRRAPAAVEGGVAQGRVAVEPDAGDGEDGERRRARLGRRRVVEGRDLGQRGDRPQHHEGDEAEAQALEVAHDDLGRRGAQRRERRRHQQPHGRGEDEAAVGRVEQHLRRRKRVQPEEPGRGQEAERDEEQAPVAAARGDLAGGVGQDRGGDRRAQHEPEVAGMVLPAHVGVGGGEQDREAREREGHERGPRDDPQAVLGHGRHPRARGDVPGTRRRLRV